MALAPFGYARPHVEGVRERVWAAHLEKEERERELACASSGGLHALTLSSLGGGLSPSAHGQRPLWPPLANCVCMHACMPLIAFPSNGVRLLSMPMGHGPIHTILRHKSLVLCTLKFKQKNHPFIF